MKQIKVKHLSIDQQPASSKKYNYSLVFVPGAGGTSKCMKNYMSFFSEQGWDCYAINLRGHAPSDEVENLAMVSIEDFADDVLLTLKELKIENAALVGHSMGGLVSQKAAELADSISGLVTLNSGPPKGIRMEFRGGWKTFKMAMRSTKALIKKIPLVPQYSIAKGTVLNHIPDDQKQEIFSYLVPESMIATNQVGQSKLPIDASRITCPKLVIACARDAMVKPGMQKKIADFLQAEHAYYSEYAHLPMLEPGWEKLAADIAEWLKTNIK